MKPKFLIKEYCKYIMPFFNGYGTAFHEITGEKGGSDPLAIDHTFGADEGLSPFVCLGGIEQAQQRLLSNKQPERENEYNFNVISKQAFPGKVIIKEISTNKAYKTFRLFWDLSFGSLKEAKYLWCWLSPAMYSTYQKKETYHSMLKVEYPTRKLVFKAIFHRFYPIDTNPVLIMVQENGKEQNLGPLQEVNLYKEIIGFNLEQRGDCTCYRATVKNPQIGQTYKVVWKIGVKNIAKYLGILNPTKAR